MVTSGPNWAVAIGTSLATASFVGASIVHPDGVDFRLLDPLWLTVGLFVLIPGLWGATVVVVTERLLRSLHQGLPSASTAATGVRPDGYSSSASRRRDTWPPRRHRHADMTNRVVPKRARPEEVVSCRLPTGRILRRTIRPLVVVTSVSIATQRRSGEGRATRADRDGDRRVIMPVGRVRDRRRSRNPTTESPELSGRVWERGVPAFSGTGL